MPRNHEGHLHHKVTEHVQIVAEKATDRIHQFEIEIDITVESALDSPLTEVLIQTHH